MDKKHFWPNTARIAVCMAAMVALVAATVAISQPQPAWQAEAQDADIGLQLADGWLLVRDLGCWTLNPHCKLARVMRQSSDLTTGSRVLLQPAAMRIALKDRELSLIERRWVIGVFSE